VSATADAKRLLELARAARRSAYAPYSRFAVGAALLAADGRVFTGVNIENASYGLTVCAERVALWKAISDGARDFVALAVAGPPRAEAAPCGACRQVLAEFAPTLMVSWRRDGRIVRRRVARLLPEAFRLGAERR
jgi:cytidine deaminase